MRRREFIAGLGAATLVQVVPFHWAASVVSAVLAAFSSSPTAVQFVAEMHDTELSSTTSPEAPGSGTVRAVQAPPVHCSASGVRAFAVLDPVLPAPTAIQAVVAGQATLCRKVSGCGSAGDSSDQAFPFQCAASALPGKG